MPSPSSRTFAFKPEHYQAMQRAFSAVGARLQLTASMGDVMTELVALRIIELAVAGERNADRLAARVLAEFGVAILVYDYERPTFTRASTPPSSSSSTTTGAAPATPAKVNPPTATPSSAPVTPAPATQPTPH
jgi:hypothetical protein